MASQQLELLRMLHLMIHRDVSMDPSGISSSRTKQLDRVWMTTQHACSLRYRNEYEASRGANTCQELRNIVTQLGN